MSLRSCVWLVGVRTQKIAVVSIADIDCYRHEFCFAPLGDFNRGRGLDGVHP